MSDPDNKQMILALTALTKPPESLDESPPSDEELAAFLDDTLKQEDRTRVKRYLAHDTQTYNRWISIVDSQQALAEHSEDSTEEAPSHTGWLSDLLSLPWFKPVVSGMVAAGLFVMIINPWSQNLDSLYDSYPPELYVSTSSDLPSRSMPVFNKAPLVKAFEFGVQQRARSLLAEGDFEKSVFARFSDEKPAPTDAITQKMIDLTVKTGEFALLQNYHCQLEEKGTFLTETKAFTENLFIELEEAGVLSRLNLTLDELMDDPCEFSRKLLVLSQVF